jgi:hypothetical protein
MLSPLRGKDAPLRGKDGSRRTILSPIESTPSSNNQGADTAVGLEAIRIGNSSVAASLVTAAAAAARSGAAPEVGFPRKSFFYFRRNRNSDKILV